MFQKAGSGRDAFTFSLQGMTTIASFAAAPAVAQDQINKAWDERLKRAPVRRQDTVRQIEDFLGHYYAPGRCQVASP